MSKFTAAVVQLSSGTDINANIAAMESGIRQAAAQGATYIQTPEMTGLVQQNRKEFFETVCNEADDPVAPAASRLAKELGVTVHLGSTPIQVAPQMAANRSYLFGPDGQQRASYDKIHMFDVDLANGESWRESAVYQPGKHGVTVDVEGALLGMAICYDCRFPELHTAYARLGVQILTGPSCFTRQTGRAHWHALLRSRAIENGAYMIAAAQGGDLEDGRETYGHSIIINPWGEVIGEVAGEEPGIALAEIDTLQVAKARERIPNLVNNRAFSMINVGSNAENVA
ncbi:MAG: carbon-nitrogen hydrolase family protein [Rhizobiaceae bacterium]|nr:carbon-nitrogen hydrolase family protein [Rhizobiaceae bacterium]